MKSMVAQFNASHPKIQVTVQYDGNTDYALQKVQTAIAGGDPPDISYLYGSWAANIAQSPKLLDLNDYIKKTPSFGWNDFWPSERKAATVDGKIVGIPALVDNLALVYNKKLFEQADVPFPRPTGRGTTSNRRSQEADRPGQEAVRVGVRERRRRGHRVALRRAAVAGRRARSSPPTASTPHSTRRPACRP